jgi:hypothetical protein
VPDSTGPADLGLRNVGGEPRKVFLGRVVGDDEQDGQPARRKVRPRR